MIRVVLDTNVVVAALRSPTGASNEVLRLAESGLFEVAISVPLVTEYEDVLHRPETGIPLSAERIDAVLDRICRFAIRQQVYFLWRPYLSDAKDDMVVEAALASRAQFIVTFNLSDFSSTQQLGIQALRPNEFLLKL